MEFFDAGIFKVVINSLDRIKAFTEFTAGTERTFCARDPSAQSIRRIHDKEINRMWITMSDEMIAQALKETGIVHGITCPPAFAGARVAKVSPAKPDWYCTLHTIKIRGYQPGCFK
jgi:hypothetical protein